MPHSNPRMEHPRPQRFRERSPQVNTCRSAAVSTLLETDTERCLRLSSKNYTLTQAGWGGGHRTRAPPFQGYRIRARKGMWTWGQHPTRQIRKQSEVRQGGLCRVQAQQGLHPAQNLHFRLRPSEARFISGSGGKVGWF